MTWPISLWLWLHVLGCPFAKSNKFPCPCLRKESPTAESWMMGIVCSCWHAVWFACRTKCWANFVLIGSEHLIPHVHFIPLGTCNSISYFHYYYYYLTFSSAWAELLWAASLMKSLSAWQNTNVCHYVLFSFHFRVRLHCHIKSPPKYTETHCGYKLWKRSSEWESCMPRRRAELFLYCLLSISRQN